MSKSADTSRATLSKFTSTTHSVLSIPTQPPRPPCWQDFRKSVSTDSRAFSLTASSTDTTSCRKAKSSCSSMHKKHRKVSSTTLTTGASPTSISGAMGLKLPANSHKTCMNLYYSSGQLKRTRSESCICEKEIPRLTLTSHESTKRRDCVEEETRKYLQDTYIKCSKWLSQISTLTPPCGESRSDLSGAPVNSALGDGCNNSLSAFEDEFSSMDVSTEDDIIGERKRYSLDRIPE